MTTPPLWHDASALNARAHQHQMRRDGRTPYASHPNRVALTCACLFQVTDETVIAAALLHDVIEDTTIDYDDLLEDFSRDVADIVAALSKDPRMIEPQREIAYDRQLANGPWQARLIKLADVFDNLSECTTDDARRRQLEKVDRALALAAHDPQCQQACDIVRQLAERVRAELG